jgi:hypothetical protein
MMAIVPELVRDQLQSARVVFCDEKQLFIYIWYYCIYYYLIYY